MFAQVTQTKQAMSETLSDIQIQISATVNTAYAEILTPEALNFIVDLHVRFNSTRLELLRKREVRQTQINEGKLPHFLAETRYIREGSWTCAPTPADILDRRVEITGPVDRKMVINALNSGAKVFMADFEDSNAPSWNNCLQGQINLRDAVNRTITFENENGKTYHLNESPAVLFVRPRGWHLEEKHVYINGEIASGSLFDFGLFFFHNAKTLLANGSGPYFYLPKLESHLEARLWNDIFVFSQGYLDIPQGSIKATVLIETILAAFETHEILYELREHSAGLNCGRWDYIFSYIKKLRNLQGYVLPDRGQVTMAVPFLSAYSQLVIQTCHQRGVHAMGGMAAQIPIKNDEAANNAAIEKVRQDKLREVKNGHDGTWVAHPALVQTAYGVFNEFMPTSNQIDNKREDVDVSEADLLAVPSGTVTEAGLRTNINVGILYIESWLRGNGAAAIYNLMEDAATAEISRTQVWQWIHNKTLLEDGTMVTYNYCRTLILEELEKIKTYVGEKRFTEGRFPEAVDMFREFIREEQLSDFLTLQAYEKI